jgi:hypothetical protein
MSIGSLGPLALFLGMRFDSTGLSKHLAALDIDAVSTASLAQWLADIRSAESDFGILFVAATKEKGKHFVLSLGF